MHVSKKIFYIGIIVYSVMVLLFWDWPTMIGTTGTVSAVWLAKMGLDILFVMGAVISLTGPSLFADDDEDEDEVALHKEDLPVTDNLLFGCFLLNLFGNGGWHAYQAVMTTDTVSFYYSLWTIAEFALLIVCWVLFSHTRKVQRRRAMRARRDQEAARNAGSQPIRARDVA